MRSAAALVLALHGVVHLIGLVTPWRLATMEGFAYRTTILGGVDIGDLGVRVLGVAWLVVTVGFLAAAFSMWRHARWALRLTSVVAIGSLVVCVLWLPETAAGVALDVAILVVVGFVAVRRDSTAPVSWSHLRT